MPIVIPREGNLFPEIPPLTQEQRDNLWECIVRNWVRNHPDELRKPIAEPVAETSRL